jgi:two-component system nitrogen regulation sensor histidine kinase NtrY
MYLQLQHERDLLNKLFDSLPVGVAYVNKEGKVEKVNETFRRLYGEGEIEEDRLKDLEKNYLRWQRIDTREGSIYILEDIQPIVLAERFKIWQQAVKRIAHEIKNPLTPIRLNLERIYRLVSKEEIDRQKVIEIIPIMLKEIERITKLINQFRHISSDRKLSKSSFYASRLLEELKGMYPEIKIDISGDTELEADYSALKDVFYNLINNSIEWGADRIRVEIDSKRIVFTDNGEGVDEEELKNIFTPHFSKNPKGMGIGMATVKKIIQDHGWEVEVFSRKGEGLKVVITLS